MAIVIIGGLVTSTLLSLFVVPALYLRFGGGRRPAMTAEDELLHRWAGVEPARGRRWPEKPTRAGRRRRNDAARAAAELGRSTKRRESESDEHRMASQATAPCGRRWPGADPRRSALSACSTRPRRRRVETEAGDGRADQGHGRATRVTLSKEAAETARHRDDQDQREEGGREVIPVRGGRLRRRRAHVHVHEPEAEQLTCGPPITRRPHRRRARRSCRTARPPGRTS